MGNKGEETESTLGENRVERGHRTAGGGLLEEETENIEGGSPLKPWEGHLVSGSRAWGGAGLTASETVGRGAPDPGHAR